MITNGKRKGQRSVTSDICLRTKLMNKFADANLLSGEELQRKRVERNLQNPD